MSRIIKFEVKIRRKDGTDSWTQVLTLDELLTRNGCLFNTNLYEIVYKRQFIGRFDNNKKEIWEGDIIKVFNWGVAPNNKLLGITQVIWDIDECGWRYKDSSELMSEDIYDQFRSVEVIGNKYEYPELMNEG